jgi:20S proteasome subunit alpha 2
VLGRKKAQEYFKIYKELIPVSQIVRELASIMQEFTQSGGVRPFGVSLLVAGYDDKGPQLYQVDPSGAYWAWKASAIGKNYLNANTFLEKRFSDEMEIEDAVHTAILTLKEGFDVAIDENNIEIGIVKDNKKFEKLTPEQIKDYLLEME